MAVSLSSVSRVPWICTGSAPRSIPGGVPSDECHPRDREEPGRAVELGHEGARARAAPVGDVEEPDDGGEQRRRKDVRFAFRRRPGHPPEVGPGLGNENREVEGVELGHAAADAAVEPLPIVVDDRRESLVPDRVVPHQRVGPVPDRLRARSPPAFATTRSPAGCVAPTARAPCRERRRSRARSRRRGAPPGGAKGAARRHVLPLRRPPDPCGLPGSTRWPRRSPDRCRATSRRACRSRRERRDSTATVPCSTVFSIG